MEGLKAARAAFAWLAACAAAQGAEVTVGTRAFTTYPFGDPDPVPCTAERRYPYFRYDGSTARPCTQAWQVVALENARLRVELLPQVGGKVYRAFDKVAGRDFLYCNRVLKFRDIAMRGPWLSGGIEFNFGIIGHAPSSATPVDWCVRTNADASVSCFVAANEYITRTAWQVEVRLAPDADAFETRTTWMNTSNLPQPYYHWMNAAYGVRGNPKLVFPGTAAIGHEGEVEVRRWPHDARGRDLSVYANNAYGSNKSYHVLPGANGFYAVWWPDAGYGSFHRNLPYEKFGRKIWLWALSRQGAIWEDLLTDADGQYMELQSGRCFNQPRGGNWRTPFKHPTFAPGATERFAESWGPVRDLKEIEAEAKAAQPAARPVDAPAGFDWGSAWGLYVRGEQALRERDDRLGAASLRAALAKDACLSPALTCLAGYEFRRGGYDAARALARRALAVNAYDAEANYLDGFAAFVARDFATARERLGVAALAPAFRAPALALVARSYLAEGDAAAAAAAAEKALAANDGNWDARLARLVAARGTPDAVRRADALLADLPLCHAARYERAKAVPGENPWAFVANELPGELFVELGSWYEETGLLEDAAALFAAAPRTHLVAQIRRAHVLARLGRARAAARRGLPVPPRVASRAAHGGEGRGALDVRLPARGRARRLPVRRRGRRPPRAPRRHARRGRLLPVPRHARRRRATSRRPAPRRGPRRRLARRARPRGAFRGGRGRRGHAARDDGGARAPSGLQPAPDPPRARALRDEALPGVPRLPQGRRAAAERAPRHGHGDLACGADGARPAADVAGEPGRGGAVPARRRERLNGEGATTTRQGA